MVGVIRDQIIIERAGLVLKGRLKRYAYFADRDDYVQQHHRRKCVTKKTNSITYNVANRADGPLDG